MTISSIASETTILSAALSQIESVAVHNSDSLTSKLSGSGQINFRTAFDTGLNGCTLVLSVLEKELLGITGGKEANHLTKLNKVSVLWKQDHLQELLMQVRGQQTALNLLISALQT